MSYNNQVRVQELQLRGWVEMSLFLRHTSSLRMLSSQKKADLIQETIKNLDKKAPFSVNERFPKEGIFVDLNHENVVVCMKEFYSAVTACKEPSEQKMLYDKLMQVWDDVAGDSMHLYGLFTRDSFEKYFRLTWENK